jgi:hypothetical protein
LKSIAHQFLKQLTTAMCMALVLVGVVVAGHAQATHVSGTVNAVDQPCHHAMSNPEASRTPTVLDLCREMCLNKIPHHAMTAAVPTLAVPRATAELAYATAPATMSVSPADQAAKLGRPLGAPPLRRTVTPQFQRLLI